MAINPINPLHSSQLVHSSNEYLERRRNALLRQHHITRVKRTTSVLFNKKLLDRGQMMRLRLMSKSTQEDRDLAIEVIKALYESNNLIIPIFTP
jgi:hypothetical protein